MYIDGETIKTLIINTEYIKTEQYDTNILTRYKYIFMFACMQKIKRLNKSVGKY